ncbi:MAG: hypothetical protein RMK01_05895 [Thermomicrobium sp.]|nr:hypothetical protein [Thermomicrobium sp.]MDW8059589.1 hypothetical protein [Thermomicrobium sp.]
MKQTWLLPLATATFLVFLGGSLWLVAGLGRPFWIVLLLLPPSFVLTTLALAVALADLFERPSHRFPFGGRLVWLVLVAGLNVLAFFPYWIFVVRRSRPESDRTDHSLVNERSSA